jgi:general secretion pathway protein M
MTALAIVLSVSMYSSLITSADRARTQLRSSIPILRDQAREFQQQASEYERLKATASTSSEPGDLRALVQSQADAAGLSHALSSIDAVDTDRTQVVLNAVPFADWISWVAALELHRIRISSSRVETLPPPGMVRVTATFIRSMPE